MMRLVVLVLLLACNVSRVNGVSDCAAGTVLQLLHIQDVSYSYGNDLANMLAKIPDLMADLGDLFLTREMAVASFSDKPILPLGDPNGDYCYREDATFTTDTAAISAAVNGLRILSGRDWPESQFDAIKRGVLSPSLGWELNDVVDGNNVMRAMLLATDSFGHLNGTLPSLPEDSGAACDAGDYPSLDGVRQVLEDNKVFSIFVVTADVFNHWNRQLSDWSAAKVLRLADPVDSVIAAIEEALVEVCGTSTSTSTTTSTTTTTPWCRNEPAFTFAVATCEVACADIGGVCNNESTSELNLDVEMCADLVELLVGETVPRTNYSEPIFPEGCAAYEGPFMNHVATSKGCDADAATEPGAVVRLCFCDVGPACDAPTTTTTSSTTTSTMTTTTTSTLPTTTTTTPWCRNDEPALIHAVATCEVACADIGGVCNDESTSELNLDVEMCADLVESLVGETVPRTNYSEPFFPEGCAAYEGPVMNHVATSKGCDADAATEPGAVVRLCFCDVGPACDAPTTTTTSSTTTSTMTTTTTSTVPTTTTTTPWCRREEPTYILATGTCDDACAHIDGVCNDEATAEINNDSGSCVDLIEAWVGFSLPLRHHASAVHPEGCSGTEEPAVNHVPTSKGCDAASATSPGAVVKFCFCDVGPAC